MGPRVVASAETIERKTVFASTSSGVPGPGILSRIASASSLCPDHRIDCARELRACALLGLIVSA